MSSLEVLAQELDDVIDDVFMADVIHGLSQSPKTLPCKYFYDELKIAKKFNYLRFSSFDVSSCFSFVTLKIGYIYVEAPRQCSRFMAKTYCLDYSILFLSAHVRSLSHFVIFSYYRPPN